MKIAILSLLAIVAVASAKPVDPFLQHVSYCTNLGLASLFDSKSLSAADYNVLGKCKTTVEGFFSKKFGIDYDALNYAGGRFMKDRPELLDALADAAGAFYKKLEGTQTGKDLIELNNFLAHHELPSYDTARKAVGL